METHEPLLTSLPVELVLITAEFLYPVDVVCLSLCSRKLRFLFGEKHRELLQAQPGESWIRKVLPGPGNTWNQDRESFLLRLSRDLPRYFFCFTCSRLHPCEIVGPPRPALQPRNPLQYRSKWTSPALSELRRAHSGLTYYRFHFFHAQLAMRGFLYRPSFGISTKSLSYTESSDDHTIIG